MNLHRTRISATRYLKPYQFTIYSLADSQQVPQANSTRAKTHIARIALIVGDADIHDFGISSLGRTIGSRVEESCRVNSGNTMIRNESFEMKLLVDSSMSQGCRALAKIL